MLILFQNLFDIQFKYCIFVFQKLADDVTSKRRNSSFIDFGRKLSILGDPPLLWTPCPDPPMIRTCPQKISYGTKRIVRNYTQLSGRFAQR